MSEIVDVADGNLLARHMGSHMILPPSLLHVAHDWLLKQYSGSRTKGSRIVASKGTRAIAESSHAMLASCCGSFVMTCRMTCMSCAMTCRMTCKSCVMTC